MPNFKSALRTKAHALSPVVMVAEKGLCDSVLKEIDVALQAHALIKVRLVQDDRKIRQQYCTQICKTLNATWVQTIGKIVVIWRENKEKTNAEKPFIQSKKSKKNTLKKRDFQ